MTGGVEKVCRGIGYALQQMHDANQIIFKMLSLYDSKTDGQYVNYKNFLPFGGNRLRASFNSVQIGLSYDVIILSHINLAPIGLVVKLLKPKIRLIVWTHGIEIWRPINVVKRKLLNKADAIVAVSSFTANEIKKRHKIKESKLIILPNALDPYFPIPSLDSIAGDQNTTMQGCPDGVSNLYKKYGLKTGTKVFLALTRLRSTEKDKNYDKVIRQLGILRKEDKHAYYILCGKYEKEEYARIRSVAMEAGMTDRVILTGFAKDEELSSFYQMADAFVLPSTKEGFGLVFIEAQACGLFVLAGNQDGSIEAVRNEQAGLLVNPHDEEDLQAALRSLFQKKSHLKDKVSIQKQCLENFGFNKYQSLIESLINKKVNNNL